LKNFRRAVVIVAIAVAIVYAAGIVYAGFPPKSVQETVVASYEQRGEFAIQAYDRQKTAGGTIFPPITEKLEMEFVYALNRDVDSQTEPTEKTVSLKAVLSEQSGAWSKEIPLTGSETYRSDEIKTSFPLNLQAIIDAGTAIEKDLDPSYDPQMSFYANGTYRLDIVATVKNGDETFTASIGGKVSQSAFMIEDSLNGASREEGYWNLYAFGYKADIRDNSLTDESRIVKEAKTLKPVALGAGEPLVVQNLEAVDAVFRYNFTGSHKLEGAVVAGTLELEGVSQDKWKQVIVSKEFTFNSSNGEILFPIDMDELKAAIRAVDDSIDYRPSSSVEFYATAKISVTGKVNGSQITEELLCGSLTGRIDGDKVSWNVGPDEVDTGDVKVSKRMYPDWVGYCLNTALVIFFICLAAIIVTAAVMWGKKSKRGIVESQRAERKKYDKEVFSESEDPMPAVEEFGGLIIQDLKTLDAIAAKAASGDSVNFHEEEGKVVYWIIVSKTVYKFIAKES